MRRIIFQHQIIVALVAILALGSAFRLHHIGTWPAGLHPDEATEGLDALNILAGARPVFLPDNNGREPLFAYLVAVSVTLLGRTPGAIRLVGIIADLTAIVGVYLATDTLFTRRIGLMASMVYAITLWPILASRFGVRWSLLSPLLSFCLWQGAQAWRTGQTRHWLWSGGLLGLAFYSYTAVRLFPLVLVLIAAYLAARGELRRVWPGAAYGAIVCAVITVPLGLYTLSHWAIVMGRSAQAAVVQPGMPPVEIAHTLYAQSYGLMRMFLFSGDWNPRQNIWYAGTLTTPRPVFDPVMGTAFVMGHLIALWRWRHRSVFLCYAWAGVMLLPTILSDEAPHFGRAAGILPVVFTWPALGVSATRDWLTRRAGRTVALVTTAWILGLSAWFSYRDLILTEYLNQPWLASTYYGGPTTDVPLTINRFLREGWTGENLKARPAIPENIGRVYVAEALTYSGAFHFLVPADHPRVIVLPENAPLPAPTGETLVLLPAGARPAWPVAGVPRIAQSWQGGWSWSPPDNHRGAPLFDTYLVMP